MPYYDTMREDLQRAKEILDEGKLSIEEVSRLNDLSAETRKAMVESSGTIFVKDIYAAYRLLESFSSELQKFYGLFSDYEMPCESFDQAQAMWNSLKEREEQLKKDWSTSDKACKAQFQMLRTVREAADTATGIDRDKNDPRPSGALGAVEALIRQHKIFRDLLKDTMDDQFPDIRARIDETLKSFSREGKSLDKLSAK